MQLRLVSRWLGAGALSVTMMAMGACGARSTLLPVDREWEEDDGEDSDDPLHCDTSADCGESDDLCAPMLCQEGRCVRRYTVCSANDPCQIAACDPDTGQCVISDATFDLDGDGHKGPLPGTVPGAPGSCGDDCDDTSPLAYPGAAEVCDGVDNDCNGVVDDGASFAPPSGGPTDVRVSSTALRSAAAIGLSHDGDRYLASYNGDTDKARSWLRLLSESGESVSEEGRLTLSQSDVDGEGVVWTGDRYGALWSERRDGVYNMYFATFDRDGQKRAPGDVRISASTNPFSINASLVWTGTEFVAVWQDGFGGNDSFSILARRISLEGRPSSGIATLVVRGESPALAVGRPGLGLTYTAHDGATNAVYFQPFNFQLRSLAAPTRLSNVGEAAQYANLIWNDERFVVWWDTADAPFRIHGTTLGGLGEAPLPAQELTDTTRSSRWGSILPLGDRMILVYSDDRDDNRGYELYSQTLDPTLQQLGLATRITSQPGRSGANVAIFGPTGDIGVLFSDQREGLSQVYFTRLVCGTQSEP